MKNFLTYPPMKMEQTECSKTSYKTQSLGNYPEESTQHSEHSKSLKSRIQYRSDNKNNQFNRIISFTGLCIVVPHIHGTITVATLAHCGVGRSLIHDCACIIKYRRMHLLACISQSLTKYHALHNVFHLYS